MLMMIGDLLNREFIGSNAKALKTYLQQQSESFAESGSVQENDVVVGLEGQIIETE